MRSTCDRCTMDALEDQPQEHPQEHRLAREMDAWWPPTGNATQDGCATSQLNILQPRRDPQPVQLTFAGANCGAPASRHMCSCCLC